MQRVMPALCLGLLAGCGSGATHPSAPVMLTDVYDFGALTPPFLQQRVHDEVTFTVQHGGPMQLTVTAWQTPYREDGGDFLKVDVLDESVAVISIRNCDSWSALAGAPCTSAQLPERASTMAAAGRTYTLRIASERSLIYGYRITVTRPE